MKITYLAHSCFLVETSQARLIIDPHLTGNDLAPVKAADVTVDYVLCSHGHEDHTGDALAIAKRCGAMIIANYEIAEYFAAKGAETHGLDPGGAFAFPFGRVKLTIAHHTSSVEAGLHPVYLGVACGLLIQADGKTIYHAGDTGLFLDMQLIGRAGLDLALLPIGDNFTMGIDDAVRAAIFLNARINIPMHYKTFDVISADPDEFVKKAQAAGRNAMVVKPGGEYVIQ